MSSRILSFYGFTDQAADMEPFPVGLVRRAPGSCARFVRVLLVAEYVLGYWTSLMRARMLLKFCRSEDRVFPCVEKIYIFHKEKNLLRLVPTPSKTFQNFLWSQNLRTILAPLPEAQSICPTVLVLVGAKIDDETGYN
jgi:hypothetical protein